MSARHEHRTSVWLLCAPGPNRFSDDHNLWQWPAQVFSTREKATEYLAAIADWFGVQVAWQRANHYQGFLIADLGDGRVWMLCQVPVDNDRYRLACLSGEHRHHRSRVQAERCRARVAEHGVEGER